LLFRKGGLPEGPMEEQPKRLSNEVPKVGEILGEE
jgi:hypothetical protein